MGYRACMPGLHDEAVGRARCTSCHHATQTSRPICGARSQTEDQLGEKVMTIELSIADYLKYADLQMAAEAFIRDMQGTLHPSGQDLIDVLREGNHHASRFTEV